MQSGTTPPFTFRFKDEKEIEIKKKYFFVAFKLKYIEQKHNKEVIIKSKIRKINGSFTFDEYRFISKKELVDIIKKRYNIFNIIDIIIFSYYEITEEQYKIYGDNQNNYQNTFSF